MIPSDDHYMQFAIQLAAGAVGQTGINPAVGCVLVNNGRLVGMGAHLRRGDAHAEIHALRMAGPEARGAVAYVTLEPCSHTGITGPCSDALISAGIRRVVVAATDPNPLVSGRGIQRLREAGIDVQVGIMESEAVLQQEVFRHCILQQTPFVTCKVASTLDARIASVSGDSRWITNDQSRQFVHALRHENQAIMVGIGTVLTDDPQLSTRLDVTARQPIRIVVDSQLRIPIQSRLINEFADQLIVLTTDHLDQIKKEQLDALGVRVLICGSGPKVDLHDAMHQLYANGIASILLEGGSRLNGSMLEARLIQKMVLFFAPKWIGGAMAPPNFDLIGKNRMDEAIRMERVSVQTFGDDVCITGYPVREGVSV